MKERFRINIAVVVVVVDDAMAVAGLWTDKKVLLRRLIISLLVLKLILL